MSGTRWNGFVASAGLAALGAGGAALSLLSAPRVSLAADTPRASPDATPGLIRSARSGAWSAPSTWEGGRLPTAGARVQVRAGHIVRYDVLSDEAIRSVHVAGTLAFDPDRDTRLEVGLVKIQAGSDASENGFDCDAHLATADPSRPRPALEVGTRSKPIDARHTARIRLVYFDGMNPESCPAIVSCGGRMEFHGAPMSRTWVKLGATAQAGDTVVTLAEPVTGWRVGDRVIVTATEGQGTYPAGTFRPRGHRVVSSPTALTAADREAIEAALAAKEAGEMAAAAGKLAFFVTGGSKLAPLANAGLKNGFGDAEKAKLAGKAGFLLEPELESPVAALLTARTLLWVAEIAKQRDAPNKEAAVAGITAANAALRAAALVSTTDGSEARTVGDALRSARTAIEAAQRALEPGMSKREAADAGISAARAAVAAAESAGVRTSPEQEASARARIESFLTRARQPRSFPVSTEERVITAIEGATVSLDRPLSHEHLGEGEFRGEVANLSRNVIVESADPERERERGHTMYHRGSAGSISYAEFRHLGKEGVLGRYSLHFHLVGNTMRGSSVVGASIWDSGNRWLTVHGTNYLVVRDCVGYRSVGHGFYVEDGTEVYNVFDRNLAVKAFAGQPMAKQNLPFDTNEGAGFWWANCLNSFTRNVAAECDRYGYRFEATPTETVDLRLAIQQPDGSARRIDIRTLPFVRFEGNEAHNQSYGVNLGEGVDGVGPDIRHPLVLRNTRIWNARWAFRPASPSMMVEDMRIDDCQYGLFQAVEDRHAYDRLLISETGNPVASFPPRNGVLGAPDGFEKAPNAFKALEESGLSGAELKRRIEALSGKSCSPEEKLKLTTDALSGKDCSPGEKLKLSADALSEKGRSPREKLKLSADALSGENCSPEQKLKRAIDTLSGKDCSPGEKLERAINGAPEKGCSSDEALKRRISATPQRGRRIQRPFTSEAFPHPLSLVDDLPPATVITGTARAAGGRLIVRGTTSDNGTVTWVRVNGREAHALAPNFAEWEVTLEATPQKALKLKAHAEDAAGNLEKLPHEVSVAAAP